MTEQTAQTQICDVLVIGGGPAGSTAATLLAQKGHRVVVLEKAKFPRNPTGELLLPMNNILFEKLGVLEQVAHISMKNDGAHSEPLDHETGENLRSSNHSIHTAHHVNRAEFDQILLDNSRAKGAQVHEETRVLITDFGDPDWVHVTAQGNEGESHWQARFLIDASGRDTFLAKRFDIKQSHPEHAGASIYAHFRCPRRSAGAAENRDSIFWFDHGWFWFIPLKNGIASVGMVCWPYYLKSRKTDLKSFFLGAIATCPPLARRLKHAALADTVTAIGNDGYLSERMWGKRYLMLGDAFAFIDPIFSSGVLLAMKSAFLGAEAVDAGLRNPGETELHMQRFEKAVNNGLKSFAWLIYRINTPAMRELFMNSPHLHGLDPEVSAMLAGKTPVRARLKTVKMIYHLRSAMNMPQNIRSYFSRRKDAAAARIEN